MTDTHTERELRRIVEWMEIGMAEAQAQFEEVQSDPTRVGGAEHARKLGYLEGLCKQTLRDLRAVLEPRRVVTYTDEYGDHEVRS